jgi:hypothetical protein
MDMVALLLKTGNGKQSIGGAIFQASGNIHSIPSGYPEPMHDVTKLNAVVVAVVVFGRGPSLAVQLPILFCPEMQECE